ncbi:uncharacterized protein LOC113385921 [Ctenocephalides felis]|uniref:uncharacterized protein LOC113385921 n=1 Tax=Ctenocephalides felis TaxID=7515 RepID=UPI000E6E3794|nr:uncharacterized protein LOC113385921 [Ctenocephalides felis]
MNSTMDIQMFLKEEREKLLKDKMRFQNQLGENETETKTNDLNTQRAFNVGCNDNSVNSKVVSNGFTPEFARSLKEDINEPAKLLRTEQKNDVSKSPINIAIDNCNATGEEDLTDAPRDMSTISRYTTTSNPPDDFLSTSL